MTTFWIICALLLVLALPFFVLPLWRSAGGSNHVVRDAANLEIYRDQVAEMDADLRNGLLTPELYEQVKHELQARVLEEVKSLEGADASQTRNPNKALAIVLAALLPLVATGLYLQTGNLKALLPQSGQTAGDGFGTVSSEAALKALEDKIAKNPQDAASLAELARSYTSLERFAEAVKAFNELSKLTPNDAGMWADFADALAMTQGQSLKGHPTMLLGKALALDPNNPKALALAGSAGMERGDYPAAIKYWGDLLKQIPPESEDAKMVAGGIQQARDFMAQQKGGKPMAAMPQEKQNAAAAGKERITGKVTLSEALKSRADPNDTLFVLARAAGGPPMPLAVMRKQVKDLPLQFSLDDSMSMAPQMKLSNFDKVEVVARISKSGSPMPQPGDMQGIVSGLKPGAQGVSVSIGTVVK